MMRAMRRRLRIYTLIDAHVWLRRREKSRMPDLVTDCPRCGTRHITFDLLGVVPITVDYGWLVTFEGFSRCRKCHRTTVFLLRQREIVSKAASGQLAIKALMDYPGAANDLVDARSYVSQKDAVGVEPPEYLPSPIKAAFEEGAKCLAVGCPNAAATMFRLCIDLGTRGLLPPAGEPPNTQVRRSLGLRLQWLFDNGKLPEALRDLSAAVKDDGNDGAHEGTLEAADAEDLLDFSFRLLERMFTEPKKLELAAARRTERRQ
jgi:hypothetical protein